MNAYKSAQEKYYSHTEGTLNKQTLALAYLQLHRENPGMHPDDRRDPESGYAGWHLLLAERIFIGFPGAPDNFKYPYWIDAPINSALDSIREFHQGDEDYMFERIVLRLKSWLDDMDVLNIKAVDSDLSELLQFHEGAPEDVWNPLKNASEVFHWIASMIY